MEFSFKKKRIKELYISEKNAHKYPTAVVDAFFEVMTMIDAADDERTFYALKSLHFEKLKGERKYQRSFKLNAQYRLIAEIEERTDDKNHIVIIDIEDYH